MGEPLLCCYFVVLPLIMLICIFFRESKLPIPQSNTITIPIPAFYMCKIKILKEETYCIVMNMTEKLYCMISTQLPSACILFSRFVYIPCILIDILTLHFYIIACIYCTSFTILYK